jgi:xylan 1,4-beta-xylosidase
MKEIRFELDCETDTLHFHDEMEIMYVLSGRCAVMMSSHNFVMGTEDVVVFNPFELHEMYRESGAHTLSFYIPMSILEQAGLGSVRCCSSIQKEQEDFFRIFRVRLAALFLCCKEEKMYQQVNVLNHLFGVLAILKQCFEVEEQRGKWVPQDGGWIKEAVLYIREHFCEAITIQEVAEHVYLSKSYLSREFQNQMGVSFSDYLRKMRLEKAAHLLSTGTQSVTDIALECGFSNTNTFIVNFRQEYGKTPNVYRKHTPKIKSEKNKDDSVIVSYMSLLRYVQYEDNFQSFDKGKQKVRRIDADVRRDEGTMKLCHREAICIGWAKDLLQENVRNAVRRSVHEIQFKFLYFHGILDDTIGIYHEAEDGSPVLSFTYMDMVFDFIISVNLRPWINFCYTPIKLGKNSKNPYGASCINLPEDLNRWKILISGVMNHLIERYGVERIRTWRYSPSNALFVYYGVFTMEEYLDYYRATYQAIRECLPEAHISGCMLDTGFLTLDGEKYLVQFLEYCTRNLCLPDALTFQCFQCDYSKSTRQETEEKLSTGREGQDKEPAIVSEDPDILEKEIAFVRKIADEHGGKKLPIIIHSWNSTIWQADLGNDTCFKAAFLFRSFLKNSGKVAGLTYCYLTDNSERMLVNANAFHGGLGLMNYEGIPKAAYNAFKLLNKLEGVIVAQGDGYVILRSRDRKKLRVGLYHYCHYNMNTHIDYVLSEEEQRSYDRYYGFQESGVMSFRFYLSGMLEGSYEKQSYSINREHGSGYDNWMNMGAPKIITNAQKEYLKQITIPNYQYETTQVGANGELILSAVLEAHEVRVITIEKR